MVLMVRFEIDKNKNQVWKYVNPVVNNLVLNQGDSIPISSNGWLIMFLELKGIIQNIQRLMEKI